VRLSTHDADDKVTRKDVELAKRLEKISWAD
jgi:pterin-4a-carbinolamine dehydratase